MDLCNVLPYFTHAIMQCLSLVYHLTYLVIVAAVRSLHVRVTRKNRKLTLCWYIQENKNCTPYEH